MEKEFVTYEQALALQELGIYIQPPVYCCYQKTPILFILPNAMITFDIIAPLKSQVFRWFREKYDYDISIRGASFRANWAIGIPLLINNDSNDGHPLVINWEYIICDRIGVLTYEEAENDCIDKLIEIAKKQINGK